MHRGVSNHSLFLCSLKIIANSKLGVSQFTKFRVAFCHCFATCLCFASCNCCHDPFTVRSAQTCPPFTGFIQLAHPSQCSRSTLTTVCFCARDSVFTSGLCLCRVSVFISGLQPRHQIRHELVTFILQWSVGSMVSRIPILQTCNVVVVLKQRLSFLVDCADS